MFKCYLKSPIRLLVDYIRVLRLPLSNNCNFVCESLVLHIFSEWSLKTLTNKTKSNWIRFSKVDFCKNLTCNLNIYVRFSVLTVLSGKVYTCIHTESKLILPKKGWIIVRITTKTIWGKYWDWFTHIQHMQVPKGPGPGTRGEKTSFSLKLFISSLQWYINLQANKQNMKRGWKKSFKLVQIFSLKRHLAAYRHHQELLYENVTEFDK